MPLALAAPRSPSIPSPALPPLGALLRLPILLAGLLGACAAPERAPEPPPPLAVEAFAQARAQREGGASASDPELWRHLGRARDLAPAWVPPMRLEDDLLRAEHLEVQALERRRAQRAQEPQSAAAHYLAARLEADLDPVAFEEVVVLDPDFAWGRYAFALSSSVEAGPSERVHGDWRRAMRQAPTAWERAYFALGLARLLVRSAQEEAAVEVLEETLASPGLSEADRAWLGAELASLELGASSFEIQRRGYERGLDLLRDANLGPLALARLVRELEDSFAGDDAGGMQLELALGSVDAPARRLLAAERALRRGEHERAEMELPRPVPAEWPEVVAELETRARLFGQGRFAQGLEGWLASLPQQVLDSDGQPAEPRLRRVLELARVHARTSLSADLLALGHALLDVGWYVEALALARGLYRDEPDAARALRRRALAGRALFAGLGSALAEVEKRRPESLSRTTRGEGLGGEPAQVTGSLDDLLLRWGYALGLCAEQQGRPARPFASRLACSDSPRLSYGPFAELVHPGPTFSAADEAQGLGPAGQPVPGLAGSMARHGRFAIVGAALGDGPDASVLRRVLVEERAGEHLGTPWRGTVAWCEGTDVESRAQRAGTSIGGAALHEGYWIDIAVVRGLHGRWLDLAREYSAPDRDPARSASRLAAVLASTGLRLRTPRTQPRGRARERTAIAPALGQAARLRLAVLFERAAPGELLGEVDLTELVDLVATHEEGHLCDRTRFLPLARRWASVLVFLVEQGFSASAIQKRLEYRAQLVALASIADPRLALVDLLEAAEARSDSGLEHGPAYRELLADFLEELDGRLQGDPTAWPRLSTEHTLMHQLHRLDGEQVRGVALELARREGLIGGG